MKHYVFCASNKCKDSIELAKRAMNILDEAWMLEHDCILQSYHSSFKIEESEFNTEISLENSSTLQLIDDCMDFARTLERIKSNTENNNI